MKTARSLALIICLFAAVPAAAGSPCEEAWARLGFLRRPLSWIRKTPDRIREVWRDEYLAAWCRGKSPLGKFYYFSQRCVLAPRSNQTDPSLRAQELKEFNWFFALMDPVQDGTVEVLSKLSSKPLSLRLSLPGSVVVGAFTYPYTYQIVRDAADNAWSTRKNEKNLAKDAVGASSLEPWRQLGVLDASSELSLLQSHNYILDKWATEAAVDKDRAVPPRIFQFQIEGLLKGSEETNLFEELAYSALHKSIEKTGQLRDKSIKNEIRYALLTHPLFKEKSGEALRLLEKVFDPPVFFAAENANLDWVSQLAKGESGSYLRGLRPQSDLFWLKKSLFDQSSAAKAARSLPFANDAIRALYTSKNLSPSAKEEIAAKDSWLLAHPKFPLVKSYLLDRVDFPAYLVPQLSYAGKPLNAETDYYDLLISRPEFHDLFARWKGGGANSDPKIMEELRRRLTKPAALK